MPIKNIYSLQPGEILVATRIRGQVGNCEIFFPIDDVGTDLLVTRKQKLCRIQVKESRSFNDREFTKGNSWHQVAKTNLFPPVGSKKVVPDFFVFLTYFIIGFEDKKKPRFEEKYLIVPTDVLKTRAKRKTAKSDKAKYSFYFNYTEGGIGDIRESLDKQEDYTEYSENWDLIDRFLS